MCRKVGGGPEMIEHCWVHVICDYTSALSIFPLDLWNTFDLKCHSQVKHHDCIYKTFAHCFYVLYLQLKISTHYFVNPI